MSRPRHRPRWSLAPALFALLCGPMLLGLHAEAAAQESALRVTEMTTARGYHPASGAVEPTTSFRVDDGRIFVVIRLENDSGEEHDITVSFERAQGTAPAAGRGGVTLHVPASRRYRTVARTGTARAPGRWRAVVRTLEGVVLQVVEFDIVA